MINNKILDFSRKIIVSQIVKDVLEYKKTGIVLDIGAGSGRNSLYLSKKGFTVTAIDQDQNTLSKLEKTAKAKKLKVNTKKTEFENFKSKRAYDVVIAINFLHFLKRSAIPRTISHIQAVTKPTGLNIIAVHTSKNKKGSRPYLFRSNELKKFYVGWKILKYNEKLGLPYRTTRDGKVVRKHRAVLVAQKI